MFQAYVITCIASGRRYVGITSRTLKCRWREHLSDARRKPRANALYAAIRKHGPDGFTMEPLFSAQSWQDLCTLEPVLIRQWGTMVPNGYNLATGGEGRGFGYKPSAESVERSAEKHRGKPCHPNTRKAASEFHAGRSKTQVHRQRIAAAKRGIGRSEETKAKLRAYWAQRRSAGDFKTTHAYEHSRKAASAMIAKIPEPLARHIARTFKPEVV